MNVSYRVTGYVKGSKKKSGECRLPSGAAIKTLFEQIGIDTTSPVIILQNGKRRNLDVLLNDHDEIKIIPIVGGG